MENTRGIALITLSMAAFTLEDMFIKKLSVHLPVGQMLILFGIGTTTAFWLMIRLQRQRLFQKEAWQLMPLLRAAIEAVTALTFYIALSLVDLSVVASLYQAAPLAITLGAVVFLGEKVGWRRWTAILIGFAGVLMIIRPGLADFDPNAIWAFVSMLFVAMRDLVTRKIDSQVPSSVISFQGFAILIPTGLVWSFAAGETFEPLPFALWWIVFGGVVFGAIGYQAIVQGMRLGDTAVVAPFRYTRLLFAIVVGMLVFSERPDVPTIIGALLIVAMGVFSVLRERSNT